MRIFTPWRNVNNGHSYSYRFKYVVCPSGTDWLEAKTIFFTWTQWTGKKAMLEMICRVGFTVQVFTAPGKNAGLETLAKTNLLLCCVQNVPNSLTNLKLTDSVSFN